MEHTPPFSDPDPETTPQAPLEEHLEPIHSNQRVMALDSLRGIAILGILLINIFYYFHPLAYLQGPVEIARTFPDRLADILMRTVAQGKFYTIFSLLFGVGMAVQMERCVARGMSFNRFFAKRMAILFLIGWVHGIFFFSGDILNNYAVIGVGVLILFSISEFSTRGLSVLVSLLYLLGCLLLGSLMMLPALLTLSGIHDLTSTMEAQIANNQLRYDRAFEIFANGSFLEVCAFRARETLDMLTMLPFFGISITMCFLLGILIWRLGIFQNPGQHQKLLWSVLLIGGIPSTLLSLAFGIAHGFNAHWTLSAFTNFGMNVSHPIQALAYVSGILLLLHHGKLTPLFAQLAYVGRMALTNYLMHSVVFSILANGYALGLYGKLGHFHCLLATSAMFLCQIAFSRFWLTRYRFGPVEWLWRSLTYWEAQPMKR